MSELEKKAADFLLKKWSEEEVQFENETGLCVDHSVFAKLMAPYVAAFASSLEQKCDEGDPCGPGQTGVPSEMDLPSVAPNVPVATLAGDELPKVIALLEKVKAGTNSGIKQANILFNMLGRRLNGRDYEDGDVLIGDDRDIDSAIATLKSITTNG